MPWNSGVYTRGYPSWITDANNSLPISATKFDTEDNDFAAGLNNCLTIDGLNKPTGTLNWAVQMNWTRTTDGNIWSLARTGGANNPKLQGSVTDATGVTLASSNGNLALIAGTGALALTASAGNVTFTGTAMTGLGPVAGTQVDMTPDSGTFTGTLTGFTAGVAGSVQWRRMGAIVSVFVTTNSLQGTSNATTMTMTGLPAAITPVHVRGTLCVGVENNGTGGLLAEAGIDATGTITFQLLGGSPVGYGSTPFTASGAKGLQDGWMVTYPL